nr:MAG TPA: hypothetical protein [Bacteriophage sp.]
MRFRLWQSAKWRGGKYGWGFLHCSRKCTGLSG